MYLRCVLYLDHKIDEFDLHDVQEYIAARDSCETSNSGDIHMNIFKRDSCEFYMNFTRNDLFYVNFTCICRVVVRSSPMVENGIS